MKSFSVYNYLFVLCFLSLIETALGQKSLEVKPRHHITLKQAHQGTPYIDSLLLESYGRPKSNILAFYLESRTIFEQEKAAFTNPKIIALARKHQIDLISGPMLGDVQPDGTTFRLRPAHLEPLQLNIHTASGTLVNSYSFQHQKPGATYRIKVDKLHHATSYKYEILGDNKLVAKGRFKTAPKEGTKTETRIAFSSGFHKIGLHNPNLIQTILDREPTAMLLLGDLAVDDRDTHWGLHRSDYLLRDVAPAFQKLAAHIPLYASWDDHDYLNNDLSGLPKGVTKEDRDSLRTLWRDNWNNPKNLGEGIYFNTQIGDVEIIMLDTRSCRNLKKRGRYGSYLGEEQMTWLKKVLQKSTAKFKIMSSGTMWSDYVTKAKDSWGTWDTKAREEIFSLIEQENINGVLLISGDRHGARAFTLPQPSGFEFYEFEVASMGGVPGPPAMAEDDTHQLFGYEGLGLKAFGEFTFNTEKDKPEVTFRLIDESGVILEEYLLGYEKLIPIKS